MTDINLLSRQTRRPDSPPHTIYYNALKLPDRVTVLPDNPRNGDVIRFALNDTNDTVWWLYYDGDSTVTYKWVPVSAADITDEIAASCTATGGTYADPTTGSAGPDIVLPLAGYYDVRIEAQFNQSNVDFAEMSYAIGATAASTSDQVSTSFNSANERQHCGRTRRKTITAANTTLTAKYRRGGGGTATFDYRTITATPIRVG